VHHFATKIEESCGRWLPHSERASKPNQNYEAKPIPWAADRQHNVKRHHVTRPEVSLLASNTFSLEQQKNLWLAAEASSRRKPQLA
jgi:hypothetical protein